jgi:hypothetical protein
MIDVIDLVKSKNSCHVYAPQGLELGPRLGRPRRGVQMQSIGVRAISQTGMAPRLGPADVAARLEGLLITVALQALRLGTSVVLDFGLWGRDERSALRWLATSAGASCQVVYLPVDKDVQLARIAHRRAAAPHRTFPKTAADVDAWREQLQVRDPAELDGSEVPGPPAGWRGWPEWASDHWPSLAGS